MKKTLCFLVVLATTPAWSVNKPQSYLLPKGATALSADKAPAGELHRAVGSAARLHPKENNLLVTGSSNGEVILWQIDTRAAKWRKQVFTKGAVKIQVSPDGNVLFATGNDGQLRVLKMESGEEVATEPLGNAGVRLPLLASLAAPLVGVVSGKNGTELTWLSYESSGDFEFGDRGAGAVANSFLSYEAALSWDGKRAAMGNSYSDGKLVNKHTLDVFDTEAGTQLMSIERSEEHGALAFSPDSEKIIFWGGARDPQLHLMDLKTQKISKTLEDDIDYVGRNRFSSDGKYVYTLASLRLIEAGKPAPYLRVYEVDTGKLNVVAPAILPANPKGRIGVSDFDVTADGKRLVLSLADGGYPGETLGNLPDFVVWDAP